jgi:uncharacterized membrane protein
VTLFEILAKFGTATLLRFLAMLALLLALHLVRTPLQITVWLLTALMGAVDRTVTTRLLTGSTPPPRPRPAWTREAPA